MDEGLTAGTREDVLARVGSDADLAAAALAEEQDKGDDARSTVTESLERIIRQAEEAASPGEPVREVGPVVHEVGH